jgi:hypothetical protein
MDTNVLEHPLIARIVAAIVDDKGGYVEYDQGAGGRETLIAASAELAAATGLPLTIVESPALHTEIRSLVTELQPGLICTVFTADEAARQPADRVNGVLAVHADVLRDADVRKPLLEAARAADHLVVVRHAYSDRTLDALAGPRHTLRIRELVQPGPSRTVRIPQEQAGSRSSEAASRLAAQIYALDQDINAAPSPDEARILTERRAGMLDALCTVLKAHLGTELISPTLADRVVAREGARRFRSTLADPEVKSGPSPSQSPRDEPGPEQPGQSLVGETPPETAESPEAGYPARLAALKAASDARNNMKTGGDSSSTAQSEAQAASDRVIKTADSRAQLRRAHHPQEHDHAHQQQGHQGQGRN